MPMARKPGFRLKVLGLKAIGKIFGKLYKKSITDREFLKKVWVSNHTFQNSSELSLHFLNRKSPRFFIDSLEKKEVVEVLKENFPNAVPSILDDAKKIYEHIFDLLGSGPQKVRGENVKYSSKNNDYEPIDWHVDFKTGYRWDKRKYYKDIKIPLGKADIKVPWELSRFQHLVTLGKAYWITDNEKYVREFVNQINDWIDNNPLRYGVNWRCTMDVAIRVVNWIWAFYFFKDSPRITKEFLLRFLKSIYNHAQHIVSNLEKSWRGMSGNHYLSDLVGLIYLGVIFPEFKDAERWREMGIFELLREMKIQVHPDGVDYEASISYHRLVTEFFLSASILCMLNNIRFPEWFMERLERMIEFIMYYTKPDGTSPQIGDNDDGRLHILSRYGRWDKLDHRYLLSVGSTVFKRVDYAQKAGHFSEEAFGMLGIDGLLEYNSLSSSRTEIPTPLKSRAFVDSGFYILRNRDSCMIVDCTSNDSKSPSGHRHNSKLSFELLAYNRSFIIDPGTYIYTASREMRNLFRSTSYHNTVVVDGVEQNRFDKSNLFYLQNDAQVVVNDWKTGEDFDLLDAQHNGYRRLSDSVIHRRKIFFDKKKGYWFIMDLLDGKGKHRFDQYFHFSPMEVGPLSINRGVIPKIREIEDPFLKRHLRIDESLVIETRNGSGANLLLIPLVNNNIILDVLDRWVSCSYGTKEHAPVIRYSKLTNCPTRFVTFVYPFTEIS